MHNLPTAFLLALLVTLVPHISALGSLQSAAVKGQLLCKGHPAKDVKVKLYDDDRGPDLDDLMDEGYTDADGRFELSGSVQEITTIDPKLNVYHDCDDWLPCQRKFSIMIPDSYISTGKTPKKVYDAGRIELQGKLKGESRDCINRLFLA